MKSDPSGYFADTILDIAFVGWDIYDLTTDGGYKQWKNWASLGADLLFTAIPFLPGGSGKVVKLANVGDDLHDLSKVTVIGETMDRVKTVAQFLNASDNLYDGFKSYNKIAKSGKVGKAWAEIIGKISNMNWLRRKLKKGFKIVDIGIDSKESSEVQVTFSKRLS